MIGLNDMIEQGMFVWESGISVSNDSFMDWAADEPSHHHQGNREACGNLLRAKEYKWNDAPCGEINPFICEGNVVA